MRSRMKREGSVGLLILAGLGLFGSLGIWLKGIDFSKKPYTIKVQFKNANSMVKGASVRYRGFVVGQITDILPEANGVKTEIEIASSDLRIPKDIIIEANQSGLIGETSIDIRPSSQLPPEATNMTAISDNCNSALIVCDGDEIQGEIGTSFDSLLRSTAKLSELYTDPEFFENLNSTAANASIAAAEIAKLSNELTLLSQGVRQEIKGFSTAANSITVAAKETTDQIGMSAAKISRTADQFTATAVELTELTSNINGLVNENRSKIQRTVNNVEDSSQQLNNLLISLGSTTNKINAAADKVSSTLTTVDSTVTAVGSTVEQASSTVAQLGSTMTTVSNTVKKVGTTLDKINETLDTAKIEELTQNLEIITSNTATASANLRELSDNLNDPANIVLLQQTLDSARATFANAQKITADLDELTGNPEFRDNLLNLVNGLSSLVSSMDELEREIETASNN